MKVQAVGGPFLHSMSTTLDKKIPEFEWTLEDSKCKIFIDEGILLGLDLDKENHYAYISETKAINSDIYSWCVQNVDKLRQSFTYVFTHYDSLLSLGDPFRFVPLTGTWIDEIYIRPKSKLVSAISSNKNWLPGHRNRLHLINNLPPFVDLYGRGFKEIEKKEEGLEDYMFSVSIENDLYGSYFTEKVLDCFSTGTVPIYLGHGGINKFFDERGILSFSTSEELNKILSTKLTPELYNNMKPYIIQNMEKVKDFALAEQHILKYIDE